MTGVDLAQAAVICGYDELFLIDSGDLNDCIEGIPYASLVGLSSSMGNALTQAIASGSFQPWVIGDDPFDDGGAGGGVSSYAGGSWTGGPGGAISEI